MTDGSLIAHDATTCPLCHLSEHIRRLLFFSYCANPVHIHAKGNPPANTIVEFRYCVVHGRPDHCVAVVQAP